MASRDLALGALLLTAPALGQEALTCLELSPTGDRLAAAGDLGVVYLWDVSTGEALAEVPGHLDAVRDLAFSPDGTHLVSRGADDRLLLHDVANGALRAILEADTNLAAAVAFSADGSLIATDSGDDRVVVLDPITGEVVLTLEGHEGYVTDLAFRPDNARIVSTSTDSTLRAWDLGTGEQLSIRAEDAAWMHAARFHPRGVLYGACGDAGQVLLIDSRTEEVVKRMPPVGAPLFTLDFGPDGRTLYAAGDDRVLRAWSPGGRRAEVRVPDDRVSALVALPDGERVAFVGGDLVRTWTPATGEVGALAPPAAGSGTEAARLVLRSRRGVDRAARIDLLTSAVELAPGSATFVAQLADAMGTAEEFERAIAYLDEELATWPAGAGRDLLVSEACDLRRSSAYSARQEGDLRRALALYEAAASFARESDPVNAAWSMEDQAELHEELDEPEVARTYFEGALALFREHGSHADEARTLTSLASLELDLERYTEALTWCDAAAAVADEHGLTERQARIANQRGLVYGYLGRPDESVAYFERARELKLAAGDWEDAAIHTGNIGWAYNRVGKPELALGYYEEQLTLALRHRKRDREAYTRSQIALTLLALGRTEEALANGRKAYELTVGLEREDENVRRRLGHVLLDCGLPEEATEHLVVALRVYHRRGHIDTEAKTLALLMRAETALGRPRLATFYGKQAVNGYQAMRQRIRDLEEDLQQSFTSSKESTYRLLADLLIEQGRLPEAQQVLDLLKQEEFFDFVRRDFETADSLEGSVSLSPEEADWQTRYDQISADITTLGEEHERLVAALRRQEEVSESDTRRLLALKQDLEVAQRAFLALIDDLRSESTRHLGQDPEVLRAEVEDRKTQLLTRPAYRDAGAVMLYTLLGEDSYRALLVTSATQKSASCPIGATELNRKLQDFRQVLQDPGRDPLPLARELYDILVAPIAEDLAGAGARTILWSLDGALRYVPMAALHDGEHYLAERFRHVLLTPASDTSLLDDVAPSWRALGLGVSQAHGDFPPLPGVVAELNGIIREAEEPEAGGVLPGRIMRDDAFTRESFERALLVPGRYQLVHIASHFHLEPGHLDRSYLLLGDGQPFLLSDFRAGNKRLQDVDLLTLSACNTATGSQADGREVDGFGVIAQEQGARAVLATLWPVADTPTQRFMRAFYDRREGPPVRSKVAALQETQRAMLAGALETGGTVEAPRGVEVVHEGPARFQVDPARPNAHPFYWAPFVLIGNWR